ncbi:MAG: hypothetical protein Q8P48_03585, partial [Deltaproteobacteria bacterium]|nr:hypothetical protein [Deltaproteobacteria bacterium]
VGYLICRLPFVGWLSRAISIIMISGALFHSGVLYLAGFNLLPFALAFIPVGGFLIAAVLLFMGVGVLSLRATR